MANSLDKESELVPIMTILYPSRYFRAQDKSGLDWDWPAQGLWLLLALRFGSGSLAPSPIMWALSLHTAKWDYGLICFCSLTVLYNCVSLQQIAVPRNDEWTRFGRTLAEINANRADAEEEAATRIPS